MSRKIYTAKNDRMFKAAFCDEENTYLLKEFLERIYFNDISKIKFLRSELVIKNIKSKNRMVDVLVEVDGVILHIEINSEASATYLHIRNFSYFSEIYNKKTLKGEKYNTKDEFLHIDLSYELSKKFKKSKRVFYVMDDEEYKYVENLKIIEYNMDRIMNFWYDEDEKNIIENLHLIILDLDIESLNKLLRDYNLSERDELFVRMFKKKIEDLNDDDYLVSSITRDEDLMRRINSEKSMSFDEGLEIGIEQGIEQGLEKGIEQGIEQGSKKTLLETAKNLKKLGVSLDKISEATGLSIDDLNNL